MNDLPRPDYRSIELNPNRTPYPFQVQTNWQVIAGAPSAGKSTLIQRMAEQGFKTIPESARIYIEAELAKGRTIQDIRSKQKDLQYCFIEIQLEVERGLNPSEHLILDRGIPDQFTYCRMAGLDPNEFLTDCFYHQYASVFILAPLPSFDRDGLRDCDAEMVSYFDEWITRDYHSLGYTTIRVPVMPVEDRLSVVLEGLRKRVPSFTVK